MTETEKQRVLYALRTLAECIEKGQIEEFDVAWEDQTLFESLRYIPVTVQEGVVHRET